MFCYFYSNVPFLIFSKRVSTCIASNNINYKFLDTRFFFYKEPTSRPSSKSSLLIDLKSANCSTKSSLIVP